MASLEEKKINSIILGDSLSVLKTLPNDSIDMIFADPPYFMQTEGELLRVEGTKFSGVDDDWDKFSDYKHYDDFIKNILIECQRVLKKDGTVWFIGSFHNIYRVGYLMQNLGFWILNDIVWNKSNPAPNFMGTRFTNANETLIWCSKSKNSKYTFNYKTMKELNGGLQMKSVWTIPICTGKERLKGPDGKKLHSTQKPEELLYRVILSSTKVNDIVLDPFMGTGTTGAVAKKLGRRYIGIERDEAYVNAATNRISKVRFVDNDLHKLAHDVKPPKVPFEKLVAAKYIDQNEKLYNKEGDKPATITRDLKIKYKDQIDSIHKISALQLGKYNNNGWTYWYVLRGDELVPIEKLRNQYRKEILDYKEIKK